MVYEVCNLDEPLCSVYFRTSADGRDYGDPLGKYPRHANDRCHWIGFDIARQ
jgi:hypothetical protein